jgi:hypothetical protein
MTAFNDAFYILKNEYMFDVAHDNLLRKGKAEEAIELRQMRQFVLDNEQSPDPAMRQAAEDMYQKLTQIMSAQSRTPPMQPPQGPIGEGATMGDMSQPAQPPQHPMMKAWNNLRKNVVGMQDGVQYSMPPSVASMAQRPLVPEMTTQTSPAPGMFGRFKQPVTTQVPTGNTVMGGPQTMNVQENPQSPMAGFGEGAGFSTHGGIESMGAPPGRAVERMPHPSPFNFADSVPNRSLAGQGYTVDHAGEFQRPKNPYEGRMNIERFEERLGAPLGVEHHAGRNHLNTAAQAQAGDQFNRRTRQF